MGKTLRTVGLGLAVLALVATVGWVVYQRVRGPDELPARVLGAERALAMPEMVALASVDIASLVALAPAPTAASDTEAVDLTPFRPFGVDLARDVEHMVGSLFAHADGSWGIAFILYGRFDPAALEAAIREREGAVATDSVLSRERVLFVHQRDPVTCDESAQWAIAPRADRVVVADAASIATVLQRLDDAPARVRDLGEFHSFRAGRLGAAALFTPAVLPASLEHPLLRAIAEVSRDALAGFDGAYFGASAALTSGLVLEGLLFGTDSAHAQARATQWLQGRDVAAAWQRLAPVATELVTALSGEARSNGLSLEARLGKDWLASAARLPAELTRLAFRSVSSQFPEAVDPAVDATQPRPLDYRSLFSIDQLPEFDPDQRGAGAADSVHGPFGIRVHSVTRSEAGPLEVELEVLSPVIANTGAGAAGAELRLTSVRGPNGSSLAQTAECGPLRSDLAARLEVVFGDELLRATKRVRLQDGAELGQIEAIVGEVALRLPTRTESVRMERPSAGDTTTQAGALLELTAVTPSSIAYEVSGNTEALLHVRALNRRYEPLVRESTWSWSSIFRDVRSTTAHYSGQIAYVEAIFALESETLRYEFELASARPGTQGEELATQSVEFIEYTPEQYETEFGPRMGVPFELDHPTRAFGTAGPFTIALDDVDRTPSLRPRFSVLAPDIPNLSYNLTGLELGLKRIQLRDGTVAEANGASATDWSRLLAPRLHFGEDELSAVASVVTQFDREVDEIARLEGNLVLRLPRSVTTVDFPAVEPGASVTKNGARIVLESLMRDQVVLMIPRGIKKLVSVVARNEQGQELRISEPVLESTPAGWRAQLHVHGQPHALSVSVAGEVVRYDYAFQLQLPDPVPANADLSD